MNNSNRSKYFFEHVFNLIKRNIKVIIFAFISLSLSLLFFFTTPLKVISFSMSPTLEQGDIVLTESFSNIFSNPKRGSVIVYKDPRNKEHPYVVKRIVALPNEDFLIKEDTIFIKKPDDTYLVFPRGSFLGRYYNGNDLEKKMGPEDYLLLGDNRPGSRDGRVTGTIQKSEMFGRVYFRVWPLEHFGFVL